MKDVHRSKGMFSGEMGEVLFRLAHFDPTFTDEYGNQVIDYLVLDALATYGPLITVTASEVKEHIKRVFKLDFAEEEINSSAKRLGQRRMASYIEMGREEKPKLQVLSEAALKIQNNLNKIKEMEYEVINNWKEEVSFKYEEYPIVKDKIELIVKNLQLFISKMFIKHGVGCVAILYPESPKTQQWLKSIESSILENLPQIDSFVDEIMKLEIPSFFKNPDPKRKHYITNLFNASFYWHLIQVDEKCSRLLQKATRGQKLYIDNNILYSLAGFHGANLLKAAHAMLSLAKSLGYGLAVTSKTTDEFRESLNWQMKELKQMPPIPKELARIAVNNLEKDSFLTCYWDEFVKNETSIEEFISEKLYLKDILEGLGIEETNKFRKDIEESQELLKEKSILRSICTSEVSDHIIEHDAFHRIFINKVRKGPKYRFHEAVAWFLTHDSKLPVYDRVAIKGKSFLPFCITSNQWVQVNRPLLMRTASQEEYEESFHILVTLPFLRTMMPPFPLEKAYNKVLGRLARYEGMSPQLALNIVADTHFMVTIASENDGQKIEEKIENKFVDITEQLQKEKETLSKDINQKDMEMKTLVERISTAEGEIKDKEKELQGQIKELSKDLEDEKSKRESAEKETEIAKERFKMFKTNLIKWSIFAGGLVLFSLILWLMLFKLPLLMNFKNKTIIGIFSQLVLIFAFLNIPLKQHWKVWLAGVIFPLIIAILSFLGSK
jgi:hypothetical protein